MQYEISCGGVVYTVKDGKVFYVIVKSIEGIYGFPKGHVEDGETEEETAMREILEETGLKVKIIPGFKAQNEYPLPNKKGFIKKVVFFVCKYEGQEIIHQVEELQGAYLMTYEEAMNAFQFDNLKEVLLKANNFIINNLQ